MKLILVTDENKSMILSLKVKKDQESFVASNILSLEDAKRVSTSIPLGIYENNTCIGFALIGYKSIGDKEESKLTEESYSLWRFMIDEKYQNMGYGRKALEKILEFIRTFPKGEAKYILLSYEEENHVAKNLYKSFGFKETGEKTDGEIIACLHI